MTLISDITEDSMSVLKEEGEENSDDS